ncbi:MAG: nucleotidyltransferase [Acidobacteriota bacterium]
MPTLLVMAAGIGSRYGGLKQMEGVGPAGETLLEYSVYDAAEVGFSRVVFVVRPEIHEVFEARFVGRFQRRIPCLLVDQTLDVGLGGRLPPAGRVKPWGTGHAVLTARHLLEEPFAVINADDFYGRDSLALMARHLEAGSREYALVGYRLRNTLSEHGSVARGVCSVDPSMRLVSIEERTRIEPDGQGGARYFDDEGRPHPLSGDELVSMNLWGFTPEFLEPLAASFQRFLERYGDNLKREFFLPTVVNELIAARTAIVRVLPSRDRWFGVTYREDVPAVRAELEKLRNQGLYPNQLW